MRRTAMIGVLALVVVAALVPAAPPVPAVAPVPAPARVLRIVPLGTSSTVGIGSPQTAGYRGPLRAMLVRDGIAPGIVGSQSVRAPGCPTPTTRGTAAACCRTCSRSPRAGCGRRAAGYRSIAAMGEKALRASGVARR